MKCAKGPGRPPPPMFSNRPSTAALRTLGDPRMPTIGCPFIITAALFRPRIPPWPGARAFSANTPTGSCRRFPEAAKRPPPLDLSA